MNVVRYGPAIFDFAAGLLLLAIGSILVAIAVGRSGMLSSWSGSLFALAFVLYIPQFFGNQPIRVAHGVLVALGCLWLAWSLGRSQR